MVYMQQYNPYAYPQKTDVVRVNGRGGAEAYQMAPNSSIILLDNSAPVVWLKTTDGAGYPTLTPYDISPHKEPETLNTQNMHSLEDRIARLEAIINESDVIKTARNTGPTGEHSTNKADVQPT